MSDGVWIVLMCWCSSQQDNTFHASISAKVGTIQAQTPVHLSKYPAKSTQLYFKSFLARICDV